MKVKELITRLLDEPMDAEVCLQDPTEHKSNGIMCNGYIFDITCIEHWSKHRICINFKDWRKEQTMNEDSFEYEPWVEKCLTCEHAYRRQADADELRCRCRKGCDYKPYKRMKGADDESVDVL